MTFGEFGTLLIALAAIVTAILSWRRSPVDVQKLQAEIHKLNEEANHLEEETSSALLDSVRVEMARLTIERDKDRLALIAAIEKQVSYKVMYETHIDNLAKRVNDLSLQISTQALQIERQNERHDADEVEHKEFEANINAYVLAVTGLQNQLAGYERQVARLQAELVALKEELKKTQSDRDYWMKQNGG